MGVRAGMVICLCMYICIWDRECIVCMYVRVCESGSGRVDEIHLPLSPCTDYDYLQL